MDRRKMLLAATAGALSTVAVVNAQPVARQPRMGQASVPFLLVHGAFHGGWAWRRVADRLRVAGHPVFTPTLTGMGERAHLIGSNVNLETHIADVVSVIENEELENVVLVGHSYAGIVVSGVADRINEKIDQLVYFDAVLPENGKSWSDFNTPEVVAQRRAEVAQKGNGFRWAVEQSPAGYGITDDLEAAWLRRRFSHFPFEAYLQPLRFQGPGTGTLRKTYINCTQPALRPIDQFRARAIADPAYRVVELAAGHDGMVNKPREVAEILLGLA